MLTVYKYAIPATLTAFGAQFEHNFELNIPIDGIILKMGVQETRSTQFQIWALVNPENNRVKRKFVFLGTGHNTNYTRLQYIDSWVTDNLVFHLFEVLD
jgi:hypothetical protein